MQQASAAAHIRYSATTWRQRHTMSLSWRAIRCSDLPTAASSPCIGRVVYFRASGGSGWTMFLSGGWAAHVRSGRVGLCSAEAMQGAIGARWFRDIACAHAAADASGTPPASSIGHSPGPLPSHFSASTGSCKQVYRHTLVQSYRYRHTQNTHR